MREMYETPNMELIELECEDIILSSTPVIDEEDGEEI